MSFVCIYKCNIVSNQLVGEIDGTLLPPNLRTHNRYDHLLDWIGAQYLRCTARGGDLVILQYQTKFNLACARNFERS